VIFMHAYHICMTLHKLLNKSFFSSTIFFSKHLHLYRYYDTNLVSSSVVALWSWR